MALTKCTECGKDISSQATACPHCGCPITSRLGHVVGPPPIPASTLDKNPDVKSESDDGHPKQDKELAKKGCLGCLGLVAVIVAILFIIGFISDIVGPSVTVNGDSGRLQVKVQSGLEKQTAGHLIATEIYKAATKHQELNKLTVNVEMTALGGLADKYGKAVEGPYIMGEIPVNDLVEVRKYRDAAAYAFKMMDIYGAVLSSLNYSHLLK